MVGGNSVMRPSVLGVSRWHIQLHFRAHLWYVAWLKDVKRELDMCSDEESAEELIKKRSEEFPKSWLFRVLP